MKFWKSATKANQNILQRMEKDVLRLWILKAMSVIVQRKSFGWNYRKPKNIRDYIAEDNEEYAAKTIKEIYGKFENLQMFPGMGSDLSKRVSFRTDYKYAIWEDYVIIYKVGNEYVEIYRVVNRYQDITRIFDW